MSGLPVDVRGPCVECGSGLGADNVDRMCGTCVERGAALEVAGAIAADIVGTAEQYPAIRDAAEFVDLHDMYDVNEAILAGAEAAGWSYHGGDSDDAARCLRVLNLATDHLAAEMHANGFAALEIIADDYTYGGDPADDCGDCGRPVVWDETGGQRYRHAVDPARGCFLIPPELTR